MHFLGHGFMIWDCNHTMLVHFENDEKCDGGKIWASAHTIPGQFENNRKFYGNKLGATSPRIWCQRNIPARQEPFSLILKARKSGPVSSFSSAHTMAFSKCAGWSSVSKIYCFKICRQKNVLLSCEREAWAYSSLFPPFSKCAGIVWTQS